MIQLATLRIIAVCIGIVGAGLGVYKILDWAGDARVAAERARVDRVIDTFNNDTDQDAADDAETLALRQRMRAAAAARFTPAVPAPGTNACLVTADEAEQLGKIH